LLAKISKNNEDAIIREHKLRKRVAFPLDMTTIRTDFSFTILLGKLHFFEQKDNRLGQNETIYILLIR